MTTQEAADRLGLSPATVRRYCWQGRLVATPGTGRGRGHDWQISETALQQFADTRQIGPGNKTGRPRRAARTPAEEETRG